MSEVPLSNSESEDVLRESRLVRVAFIADVPYVIALGFTYFEGCLVGTTAPGRKTELAGRDPRVGFQLDTRRGESLYEWESVRGEGRITFSDPEAEVLAALRAAFPNPPEWFISDRAADMRAGTALTFRIEPTALTGVRSGDA